MNQTKQDARDRLLKARLGMLAGDPDMEYLDALRKQLYEMFDLVDAFIARKMIHECKHEWQEQPGEPPVDACSHCGAVRH